MGPNIAYHYNPIFYVAHGSCSQAAVLAQKSTVVTSATGQFNVIFYTASAYDSFHMELSLLQCFL
jgi:hypothetical protein